MENRPSELTPPLCIYSRAYTYRFTQNTCIKHGVIISLDNMLADRLFHDKLNQFELENGAVLLHL
jgi:hypothetical protein